MTTTELLQARLNNQQLQSPAFTTPTQVLSWMGALQAQDYAMSKWAVGIRANNSNEQLVEKAIDDADIIRTHVLRPTWHLVAAKELHWMLALTAPGIIAQSKTREKQLELTEPILRKTNKLIQKLLQGGNYLDRETIMQHLEKAKINTRDQRAPHILIRAELEGLICSGKGQNKKHTYALLQERVPETKKFNRDEALEKLALIYFNSRGPATIADFAWWSGLSVTEARKALEMVQPVLMQATLDDKTYWFSKETVFTKPAKKTVYCLPAFDEYLISYKDRTAIMPLGKHKQAMSVNGIFWPTLVANGKVFGQWGRSFKKDKVLINTEFFEASAKSLLPLVKKSFRLFSAFLEKEVVVELGKKQI